MQASSLNKKPIIIAAIIVGIMALAYFIYFSFFTFRVTGTTPSSSPLMTATPFITFSFNKPLKSVESAVGYSANSVELVSGYTIDGSKLKVSLNSLEPQTQVTFVLKGVVSTDEYTINEYKFSAKTIDTDFDKMSKEQQQEVLIRQDAYGQAVYDPILDVIPYSTLSYSLSPVSVDTAGSDKPKYKIELTISLSAAEVRIDADAARETYRKAAMDYLVENNIDPSAYEIEIINNDASLY